MQATNMTASRGLGLQVQYSAACVAAKLWLDLDASKLPLVFGTQHLERM